MPRKLRPTGLGSGIDKDRPTTPSTEVRTSRSACWREGIRVGALHIYRLRDEPRAIILVAYQVRLEGDVQAAKLIALYGADRAIQTCATILPVRFAQRSARTGTAAARILSSPSTYRDDHASRTILS